jgi:DNA-binding NarL/FixJ family response regulator
MGGVYLNAKDQVPDEGSGRLSQAERSRVFILDDHPLVCEALSLALNSQPDLVVCGWAISPQQALVKLGECQPHIMIVDISLDGESGLEFIRVLRDSGNRIPVLVLSMHREDLYANSALRMGAQGYVQKTESSTTVIGALRKILKGEIYLSEQQASRTLSTMIGPQAHRIHGVGIQRLSDREREIFEHMGRGLSSLQIAKRLHISSRTVETHRTHIKCKLGVKTRSEMLHMAIRWVEREGKSEAPVDRPPDPTALHPPAPMPKATIRPNRRLEPR